MDAYERKEEDLAKKQAAITATQNEVNLIKKSQMEVLEKISGLTQDEAKNTSWTAWNPKSGTRPL